MINFKDLLEDLYTSEYKIKQYVDPETGETKTRKIRPHRIEFKNSKMQAEPVQPKQVEENNMFENVDALIVEVLTKDASAGEWIHDFIHSDNPKFAGKSPAKRKEMALAAYYAKQRNEEVEEELKGNQHKLDKNKNGKLDATDFKLLRKEEQIEEKSDQAKQNKTMKNMMDASRGARYKLNNPVPGAEPQHKTAQAHNKAIGRALRNEEAEETDTSEKNEMAENQLHFIKYAAEEILEYIKMGGEIEEWYQNKLSKVQSELESLHSYVEGESRRTGIKENITENKDEMKNKKSFKSFMKKPSDCQETMGVQGYAGAAPVTQVLSKEEKEKEKEKSSWKVETPWKKMDAKKNPEGKVHNLAGMALKKTQSMKEGISSLEGKAIGEKNDLGALSPAERAAELKRRKQKIADNTTAAAKKFVDAAIKGVKEEVDLEEAAIAPVPGQKFKDHAVMVNGKRRVVIPRNNMGNYSKEEGWREVSPGTKIKESVDDTGELSASQISYKEFVMMLEGQTIQVRPGVTRHIGTYGTAKGAKYGSTDYERDTLDTKDDDKKQEVVPTTKRGRGRPAGAKSGANQKVTSGKSEKNYADYTGYKLHLPNTNK